MTGAEHWPWLTPFLIGQRLLMGLVALLWLATWLRVVPPGVAGGVHLALWAGVGLLGLSVALIVGERAWGIWRRAGRAEA